MKWQRRYTGLCLDCCSCQVGEGVMQFIGLSWRDSCHAESGRIYSRVTKERMTNWKLSCADSCCRHYTDGMLHRGVRSSVWNYSLAVVPKGSPSRGGDVTVHVWHKPAELAHSFLFCFCVCFCLYGRFNCIAFHKLSRRLSVCSLCSCVLSSAVLVLSTICLCMKVSFSPDIIPSGWLDSNWPIN